MGEGEEQLKCAVCGASVDEGQTECTACSALSNEERDNRDPAEATTPQMSVGEAPTEASSSLSNGTSGTPPSPAFYLLIFAGIIGGVIGYFMLEGRDKQMARRILIAGSSLTGVALLITFVQMIYVNRAVQSFGDAFATATQSPAYESDPGTTVGSSTGTESGAGSQSTPAPAFGLDVTDFKPVQSWTFVASQEGGYKETGTLEVGEPIPAAKNAYFADIFGDATLVAGSACAVDPDRDALIPFRLELTNSTAGFDAQVAASMQSSAKLESNYAGGPTCEEDGVVAWQSVQSIPPQDAADQEGFILLEDYFTPNTPNGDAGALASIRITLAPERDSDGRPWVMDPPGVAGPGVVPDTSGIATDFYLSGAVPPQVIGSYSGTIKDGTAWNVYIDDFDGSDFSGTNEVFWANTLQGFRTSFTGTFDPSTRRIVMSEDRTARGAGEFVGEVSADGGSMAGTWTRYSDGLSFNWSLTRD